MDINAEIEKLSLRPGDIVLIRIKKKSINKEEQERISTLMQRLVEENPSSFIIVPKYFDFSKLRLAWVKNCGCNDFVVMPQINVNSERAEMTAGPKCNECGEPWLFTAK